MGVPSYGDLGKSAREVLRTGYHYGKGLLKLQVSTKADDKYGVFTDATFNHESSIYSGEMAFFYRTKNYGNVKQRWTSDGDFVGGYDLCRLLSKNLNLRTEGTYNPSSSSGSLDLGADFANDFVNARCNVKRDASATVTIGASSVMSLRGLLFGYRCNYDKTRNSLSESGIALAYDYNDDIDFCLRFNSIPHECGLSLLYKGARDAKFGLDALVARRGERIAWLMGAGTKVKLDEDSTMRLKLDTDMQLAASLQQAFGDVATITLSCKIDCGNLATGGHKVGLALHLKA